LVAFVRVPVGNEPDADCAPDHAALAVQAVASVERHLNVVPLPVATSEAKALKVSCGFSRMDTLTLERPDPPGPVQAKVKVLVPLAAGTDSAAPWVA